MITISCWKSLLMESLVILIASSALFTPWPPSAPTANAKLLVMGWRQEAISFVALTAQAKRESRGSTIGSSYGTKRWAKKEGASRAGAEGAAGQRIQNDPSAKSGATGLSR